MVLGKKVTIFNWEWGRISAPRERQQSSCKGIFTCSLSSLCSLDIFAVISSSCSAIEEIICTQNVPELATADKYTSTNS